MIASVQISGDDSPGGTEKGQMFTCPDCATEVQIRDIGALFVGGVISAFWLAVGYYAFIKGPLWYFRHWEYMFDDGFRVSFLLMDGFVLLLSLGAIVLSGWVSWTFLLSPLRDRALNPVVGENRKRSTNETVEIQTSRRQALMAFFVYPLAIWIPLLGVIYSLDLMNVDMRGNGIGKNALVFGLLALIYYLARRIGSRAYYAFIGMAFWLAVIVGLIFTIG